MAFLFKLETAEGSPAESADAALGGPGLGAGSHDPRRGCLMSGLGRLGSAASRRPRRESGRAPTDLEYPQVIAIWQGRERAATRLAIRVRLFQNRATSVSKGGQAEPARPCGDARALRILDTEDADQPPVLVVEDVTE
jgi:hypothetical protein